MSNKEEMKNGMVKELASLLMERNPKLNMGQALAQVFNSDTYQKMLDDRTGLYCQSPLYVFSYLETELKTGKVG